jgi:iron complex transport system substrate-binding protein
MAAAPLRALALALLLLLTACADDTDSDSAGSGTTDVADDAATGDDATDTASSDSADTDTDTDATVADGNRTDGCVDDHQEGVDLFPDKVELTEADGARVTYADTYKTLEIDVPGVDEPVTYALFQCGTEDPEIDGAIPVEVPVTSIVSLTTTNLPHLDELGAVDRLVGVGTGAFVSTPSVLERVEAGELPDFADASGQADLEQLVGADPDLLIVDAFGDAVLDDVARFSEAGVTTALNADFDEQTLLGRAEWLKVTALFLNAEAEADTTYDEIADAYAQTVAEAEEAAAGGRPRAFVNTPFEGTWFTPGGASFLASAIADAGGEYVFADDDSTGSLSLDIETVLDRAADADVWLQAGSVDGTIDDLLAQDPRFAEFEAVEEGEVWAFDAQTTENGGNAVFELAYTRADLFLADLFAMLHPEQGGDHDLVFFGRVGGGE